MPMAFILWLLEVISKNQNNPTTYFFTCKTYRVNISCVSMDIIDVNNFIISCLNLHIICNFKKEKEYSLFFCIKTFYASSVFLCAV